MADTLQHMVDHLRDALESKLHVRGASLDIQIRKAGRRLPRRICRDATYLARAARLKNHPKLIRMVDMVKAKQAHRNVADFLDQVDPKAEQRETLLGIITSIAFAVLATGILFLFTLWAGGFV